MSGEGPSGSATFLFSDIEDSARHWESSPTEMIDWLAGHDRMLKRAVEVVGGEVVKHTGDGIMAVFADPVAALQAASTAQRSIASSDLPFRVRVGLTRAAAEPRDGDYFGLGPTLAARIMSAAHGGQILVGDAVASSVGRDLPGELVLEDLGEFELRGITGRHRLWQLAGPELQANFPPPRTTTDAPEVLVGRKAELDALDQLLWATSSGSCAVALLIGEAGIGKSRLADETARLARRRGYRVVRGETERLDRSLFGLWEGVWRSLRLDPGSGSSAATTERRWEMLESLTAGLVEVAPILVVLEDLHWADESSIWILDRLPRRLEGHAVMFVATTRPDEPDASAIATVRRQASVFELTGLDIDGVRDMTATMSSSRTVDPHELLVRTAGNPLFVRELLATGGTGDLPAAAADVLNLVLARLDSATQRTLVAFALAGRGAPLSVLAHALDLKREIILQHLDSAAAANILRTESDGSTAFRHVLFEEAAQATAGPADRRALHIALADAWAIVDPSAEGLAAAATHRLAAMAALDPQVVAADTLAAVLALRAQRLEARGAELARVAVDALDRAGEVATETRARLEIEHAEALTALGDIAASTNSFRRAADLYRGLADPDLRGRAEVGASTIANPFVADFDRLSRLEAVEAVLESGDRPLRVKLLGRISVLRLATTDLAAAHEAADQAIAIARRLNDPELLVQALTDRHLVADGPKGLDLRAEAAEEIISIGERLRRPDLALPGYEWLYADRLDRGDRNGAVAALRRLELYAEIMPSPVWRWSALARGAVLHAVDGNHAAALGAIADAAVIGAEAGDPLAAVGLEHYGRASIALTWGLPDPDLPAVHARMWELGGGAPAPFIDIVLAFGDYVLGDHDRARSTVRRYAPTASSFARTMEGETIINILGILAAELGCRDQAGALYDALVPFEDRLGIGSAASFVPATATTLGRLAVLQDDAPRAIEHHAHALRLVSAIPSPTLEAEARYAMADALDAIGDASPAIEMRDGADRISADVGMAMRTTLRSETPPTILNRSASIRVGNPTSELRTPLGSATVRTTDGIRHLAHLLVAPHVEMSAVDLAGGGTPQLAPAHDLGPGLDARAKREFRQRIAQLQAEIDDADQAGAAERRRRAEDELDALASELKRAVGAGGRDRPVGSGAERARVNVTRALTRAISAMREQAPDLAAHLERSLRTGYQCCYSPEPAVALDWHRAE